ncbi:MAG TPA: hypothetical protein VIL37_15895 [Natronosporangium sp.]
MTGWPGLVARLGRIHHSGEEIDQADPERVCQHALGLLPVQQRVLGLMPDAGRRPPAVVRCLRPAGHRGRHISDAVESVSTDQARWVSWHRRRTWILDRPLCHSRSGDECCHLPDRHPGPHTYAYLPQDLRWWYGEPVLEVSDYGHHPDPGNGG